MAGLGAVTVTTNTPSVTKITTLRRSFLEPSPTEPPLGLFEMRTAQRMREIAV